MLYLMKIITENVVRTKLDIYVFITRYNHWYDAGVL
jgi:hypothetical protein